MATDVGRRSQLTHTKGEGIMTDINDVYAAYKKHLYIEDTHLIDISLAIYITKELPGDPLWLFPLAPSGMGKTTIVFPLLEMAKDLSNNIVVLDSVTAKAFTAKEGVGKRLERKNSLIIVPDLAGMLSSAEEPRTELFATLRTLFDGDINRKTHGTGTTAEFHGCHVNMLALGVPNFKEDIEMQNLMGTREILYDMQRPKDWKNMYGFNITSEGKKEICKEVKAFLSNKFVFTEPTDTENKFLQDIAEYISVWRVEPIVDLPTGLIKSSLNPEISIRVFKQLKKLCIGLTAMGVEDAQRKSIISTISKGCGNEMRRMVYEHLAPVTKYEEIWSEEDDSGYSYLLPGDDTEEEKLVYPEKSRELLSEELNCDPKTILTQLMVLRAFGYVEPYVSPVGKAMIESGASEVMHIYKEDAEWKRVK